MKTLKLTMDLVAFEGQEITNELLDEVYMAICVKLDESALPYNVRRANGGNLKEEK